MDGIGIYAWEAEAKCADPKLFEKSPPGFEGTVKAMKDEDDIDNPWALCLVGETEIPCLDGVSRTVREISESGEDVWVYGFDRDQFLVVPAVARARYVGPKRLVEIELDNGEALQCSPEHRWVLRDGSVREARQLSEGDCLIPFKRCYVKSGHEKVYQPGLGFYAPTQWSVMRCVEPGAASGGYEIHHQNEDPKDNRPENLEWLTKAEHCHRHPERMDAMRSAGWSPEAKDRHRRNSQRVMSENWQDPEFRDRMTRENRANARRGGEAAARVHLKVTPEIEEEIVRLYAEEGVIMRELAPRVGLSVATVQKVLSGRGFQRGEGRGVGATNSNHQIVSIRMTDRVVPMYDVAVDGVHIFAVQQGVFSHNSWWMKNKGYKSHKKKDGSDKKESVFRRAVTATLREEPVWATVSFHFDNPLDIHPVQAGLAGMLPFEISLMPISAVPNNLVVYYDKDNGTAHAVKDAVSALLWSVNSSGFKAYSASVDGGVVESAATDRAWMRPDFPAYSEKVNTFLRGAGVGEATPEEIAPFFNTGYGVTVTANEIFGKRSPTDPALMNSRKGVGTNLREGVYFIGPWSYEEVRDGGTDTFHGDFNGAIQAAKAKVARYGPEGVVRVTDADAEDYDESLWYVSVGGVEHPAAGSWISEGGSYWEPKLTEMDGAEVTAMVSQEMGQLQDGGLFSLGWDSYDAWGSIMMHFFGVAEALYVAGEDVPYDWQFQPGAGGSSPEWLDEPASEYYEMLQSGEVTPDQLRASGNLFNKWADAARDAGMDY
jgi:hypothetical protein